jgi:pimeloyl-ACP methyl ester carboxylesterase
MNRRSFLTLAMLSFYGSPAKGESIMPSALPGRAPETRYATSADGTRIAFNLYGQGAPVILIAGILSDRRRLQGLADALARDVTVIHFDRRGRGQSGDTAPYALAKEVEDIAALVEVAGGSASVYGHSSGAGLAAHAAAGGVRIDRLVLHEPPFGPDDEASKAGARAFASSIQSLIRGGRHVEAITTFMEAAGVPAEMIDEMIRDPDTVRMAPTMLYDIEIMGEIRDGGSIPRDIIRVIEAPTLVLAGQESPPFFMDSAADIAGHLHDGRLQILEGADHGAPAELVAPAVAAFLRTAPQP